MQTLHFQQSTSTSERTDLISLIKDGKTAEAIELINSGADVNARDSIQRTPLHAAARQNNTEVMKLLISKGADLEATMHYKRYQTKDSMLTKEFELDGNNQYIAQLPVQPAAGKMEYYITGSIDGIEFNIPEAGEDSIVLRYKDPVSDFILIPHVVMMIIVPALMMTDSWS